MTYNQEVVDLTSEERRPGLEERMSGKREPTAEKNGLCPPRYVSPISLIFLLLAKLLTPVLRT